MKETGADVKSKTTDGWTSLSLMAVEGHLEVVKFLVQEAGADVESKITNGWTPLSLTAAKGHLEVVKFLVKEAGADVESKDKDGKTALDLARQGIREGQSWEDQGRRAVAAWLEKEKQGGGA